MSQVFVLQEMQGHDYSAAESYGKLVFIGTRDINSRFPIMGTPGNKEVVLNMFATLNGFEDDDYVVISGNPVIVSLALHYLITIRNMIVRLLKWDNRALGYCVLEYPGIDFGVFFGRDK